MVRVVTKKTTVEKLNAFLTAADPPVKVESKKEKAARFLNSAI